MFVGVKFSITRYFKMTPFAIQIKIKERNSWLNNYIFSVRIITKYDCSAGCHKYTLSFDKVIFAILK